MRNISTSPMQTFLHLILIMRRQFRTFAPAKRSKMVTELLIVWALGVVAFFVLWALLAKVVQRITRKRNDAAQTDEKTPEDKQSTNTEQ